MRKVRVRVYRRNPSRKHSKHSKRRKHTHYGKVRAHKRRVNPFMKRRKSARVHARRKSHSGARRRNPVNVKGILSLTMRGLAMGGGFILGKQVIGLASNGKILGRQVFTPPAILAQARPVFGVLSIIVGALVMKKAKGERMKDVGMGMVTAGGVDIVTTLADKVSPGLLSAYVDLSAPRTDLSRHLGAYVNRDTTGPLQRLNGIPIERNAMAGAFSDRGGAFGDGGAFDS